MGTAVAMQLTDSEMRELREKFPAVQSGALRCEKAILAAFRVFDTDGNGQISKTELGDVMMFQGTDQNELDKLLDPWDADGNGQLSFEEFRAMVLSLGVEITSPTPPPQ